MIISIADFVIDVKNKYRYFDEMCKGYEAPEGAKVDFTVKVSDEIMRDAVNKNPGFTDGYIESLEIYRIICRTVLDMDTIIMHSAAISVDGEAYLFTAVSGTGKTTHTDLWLKKFGERAYIVNGDKPLLRLKEDGRFYACGTPWCGKEGYGVNKVVPIKGICILERGKENHIEKIPPEEAISTVITQTLRTDNMEEMAKMLEMTDKLLKKVPFYRLQCNMNPDAADCSYNEMSK